eukprot:734709_1
MGCCLSSAKPDEDLELDKDLMALEEANGGTGDPPENFVDNVKFGFANLMDDVRSGFSKVKNFDRIKSGADKFFDKDRTYNQRMPLVVALLLCIIVTLAVLYGSAYAVHGLSGSQSQQTNDANYEAIPDRSTYSSAPPTKKSSEEKSDDTNNPDIISTEQTIAGLAFPYGGSKAATRKPHRERGVPQYFQLIDKQPGVESAYSNQSEQTNVVDYEADTETYSSSIQQTKKSGNPRTAQTTQGQVSGHGSSTAATRKPQHEMNVSSNGAQLTAKQSGDESTEFIQPGGNSPNSKQCAGLPCLTTPDQKDKKSLILDNTTTYDSTQDQNTVRLNEGDANYQAINVKSVHSVDVAAVLDVTNLDEEQSKPYGGIGPNLLSLVTPDNDNDTHETDNTETPLASHSIVDHLNEEQNDNKPGEETKSNSNVDMEPKSDATPVNSNAINTVITGPPLTSHFYDAPQVGHPDEEQKDNKHGEKLLQEEQRTDDELAGDVSDTCLIPSITHDTAVNAITTVDIQSSQTLIRNIDNLNDFINDQHSLENDQDATNAAISELQSALSTNDVKTADNLNHEENVRKQGSINASDSKKSQTSLVTNNEDWNEVGRDNTHFVEQQKKIHQVLDSRFELKVDANGNQIPRGDGCPLVELNNDLQDNNQSSRSLTNELDNATTLSVNMASTDNQRGSNNTLESADSTNALNNVEEDRKESDSTTYEDVLTDDLFYTNSNDGDQGASGFSKSDLDAKVSESKERLLDGIRTYRQKKRIVDERQLVKYNPQIHSPESKERRIMLDRFHAYNQKTHYSNLDPRIMSFLNTSSKNIANQFQTVKYNSPIRRVSHTPESKERRIMLDRVQSYYQKTHFADDYHNDTSNTNDVVFPRFSILQDNSQEGMCFVILYPSASHDSVDNYQILSGVQDVVTESFDARSIQDTTIFPAKVISNTYPKSLILRATLKDGSCIDSGVPLPPPSVAFTLKMGTDNSDTVLDLRRAVGITDDEATEYQLSVGPDRDDMSGIIHQFTGKVAHEKNGMLKVDSTNLQGAKVGRIRAIKYIGGRNGNRVISDSFTEIKSDEVSTGHDDDDYEDDVDDDDDNKRSDHDDEHDKRDGEEDDEGGDDDEERVEADGNYDDNDDNNGGEASKDDNVPESHQDGGGGSGDGNEHGVSINDVSESHEHGRGGSGYGSKHGASINDGFDDGKECDTSNFKGSLDGKENESYKGQYVSDDNHVPNKKHNDNDIQHDPTKSTSIANGSNKYDEKEDRVMVGDESKYNESDQHQDAVVESQEDEKNESVRTHKHGEDTKDGEQGIKAAAVVLEDAKGSFTLTKDSEHSGNKGNPVGSNIYERHLRIPRKNLPDQGSINLILEAKNSRSIEFREFIVNG